MPLVSSFVFRLPGRWTRRRARRTRMLVLLLLLAVTFLIVLPVYVVYKPPKALIGYFQTRFPDVLFQIPNTSRKIVALTIDDVPSQYTGRILEILEGNDAHATFFVIGNQVAGQENTLVDIVKAGSELGNHAMHDEPSISLSSEQLNKEISEVDDMINKAYSTAGKDRTAHYFRPGSGVFSRRILGVAANAGYKTILGSIYPHDPFIKYWRVNAKHILSSLRPGAIIICHDRRSWTIPMLEHVIPEMKRRGYEIVTVSGLLKAMED
ncbi:Hypothetical protein R9X50_00144700 [Acrodontium crateriforme]|uniref:chitin deacetylase n=1 Tax=Acrodontium crateriforme TaxID=150365 RepID=A0AAQ3M0S2_9PEZI|nr:Hypothetical protein R9X50_00144700 [Acrodontium crateriforme]